MVHALASVDAGIIGAGHETMPQRCFLAIKEGDLGPAGFFLNGSLPK